MDNKSYNSVVNFLTIIMQNVYQNTLLLIADTYFFLADIADTDNITDSSVHNTFLLG